MPSTETIRFLDSPLLRAKQSKHFLFTAILPAIAVAVWLVFNFSITWHDIALLLGMHVLICGFGVSIGFHRYFTHRSFKACGALKVALAAAGSMSAQGPLSYWVSIHRCHHMFSDVEKDPHSPLPLLATRSFRSRLRAFIHGHMGWVLGHSVPSASFFARDLRKDTLAKFFDRTYSVWVAIGILLPGIFYLLLEPTLAGFLRGCVFGGLLRMLFGNQVIWSVNSVCHSIGHRDHRTGDSSTNNWLLAAPTFGESWHNNHHAYPWSAKFSHAWWQFDFGWLILKFLIASGLASNAKQPTPTQLKHGIRRNEQLAIAENET